MGSGLIIFTAGFGCGMLFCLCLLFIGFYVMGRAIQQRAEVKPGAAGADTLVSDPGQR